MKKVFWKYLGSIFSVVIWQLLSVWEVSLTLPFGDRSGILSFGWTIFLRSHALSPSRNLPRCAAQLPQLPLPQPTPQAAGLHPRSSLSDVYIPHVGPERGPTARERERKKMDKRGWHEPSGFFILDSLCVTSSCLDLPEKCPSWGFFRIMTLG